MLWTPCRRRPNPRRGDRGAPDAGPGFVRTSGLAVSTLLTVVASFALYVTFKRKDWL
jgi:hypothetical protein